MGQKSNLITLRNAFVSGSLTSLDNRWLAYIMYFVTFFRKMLLKKNVIVSNITLNFKGNVCFLTLDIFFSAKKLNVLKKRTYLKGVSSSKNSTFNRFASFLSGNFFFKKVSFFFFKIKTLNLLIDRTYKKNAFLLVYQTIKGYKNILFLRKYTLYVDFIKITSLLLDLKINCNVYLYFLAQIFKSITKKKHSKFVFFINQLFFNIIYKNSQSKIKGIKFEIRGKLKGKTRKSATKVMLGKIQNSSFSSNIHFSKIHVYTIYGAFGFKIWLNAV